MKIRVFSLIFMFFPTLLYAEINPNARLAQINQILDITESAIYSHSYPTNSLNLNTENRLPANLETASTIVPLNQPQNDPAQKKRNSVIEKALSSLEISLDFEYSFGLKGGQTFEIIDSRGRRISKLHYSHRGQMYTFKGEAKILPQLFIAGRYGSSNFKKSNSTDTNWQPATRPDIWFESHSRTKTALEISDLNFYYRIFDLNTENIRGNVWLKDLFDYFKIGNKNDKITFDLLAGYQWQKGRYGMTNLVDTMEWWVPVNNPINGQDSFYKIVYRGPRLGFRTQATSGKFSTKIAFAYSLLSTKAYGWWNTTTNIFEQHGKNGYGFDLALELDYEFTPHLLGGVGFNYLLRKQKNLKESANQPGLVYDDLDIVRNTDSSLYGPSIILRYIW